VTIPPRCTELEQSGLRCQLVAVHDGDHLAVRRGAVGPLLRRWATGQDGVDSPPNAQGDLAPHGTRWAIGCPDVVG
jgi:hypothetical protein